MLSHYASTAFRHFRQHLGTTTINVACLTFGLVVFLLAWGRTEYFANADRYHERGDRTVILTRFQPQSRITIHIAAGPLAEHLRTDFPDLEHVARIMFPQEMALATSGQSQFGLVAYADAEFLKIFDLPFAAGDRRNALEQPNSIVISEMLAQRLFGTSNAIGKTVRLDGRAQDATVTGIVRSIPAPTHLSINEPAAFGLKLGFDALVSMEMNPAAGRIATDWNQDAYMTYAVLAREGPEAIAAFDDALKEFTRRRVPPDLQPKMVFGAKHVSEFMNIGLDTVVRADATGVSSAAILRWLGVLVLAIACLNYTNLATAVAMTHAKEVALRKVVGASRWQLAIQHFIEGALLTSTALIVALCVLGVVLLMSGADVFMTCLRLLATPGFALTLFVTLLIVSIGASAYPAFVLSRVKPAASLHSRSLRGGPRALSTLLVGVQFAGASFLMLAVLIMLTQHQDMRRAVSNPDDDPLLTIANNIRGSGIDPVQLRAELARQPGVRGVSGIDRPPWSLGSDTDPLATSSERSASAIPVSRLIVAYDFFETMAIPLLAGRTFERTRANDTSNIAGWIQRDPGIAAEYNTIVDERYLPYLGVTDPQAAIGREIFRPTSTDGSTPPHRLRIIGVAQRSAVLPMNLGMPVFYLLNPEAAPLPVLRIAKEDVPGTIERIEAVWHARAPNIPLRRRFSDEQFDLSFSALQNLNNGLGILSIIAAAVAVMGLIGMALHVIRRRMHEIGVRKTLGARASQIYAMLLRSFSMPVVIANVVVWPLVYILMSAYLGIFANSTSLTAWPFILTLAATLGVACLAVSFQALRAARMNPAKVLRDE